MSRPHSLLLVLSWNKNLDQGRKILAAGHELGNHSYSHTRMMLVVTLSSSAAAAPPDVRRGYASPFTSKLRMGCAHGSGFALFTGQRPNDGPSPNLSEF